MTYLDPQPNDERADNAAELEFKRECQLPPLMKCTECNGYGYTECVAYYYGRAECSRCGGSGIDPDDERDWDNLEREER